MSKPGGGDPTVGGDPMALALADQIMAVDTRLDELTGVVSELATGLNTLAQGTSDQPGRVRPRWWSDLEEHQRGEQWQSLVEWLQQDLLPHQPEFARTLRACWSRHLGVIDELTALYTSWLAAYRDPRALPAAASEWLDRWAPGAHRRIQTVMTECKREHVEPKIILQGDAHDMIHVEPIGRTSGHPETGSV